MSVRVCSWGLRSAEHDSVVPLDLGDSELPNPASMHVLPFGLGRSYGDVCLNEGGSLLATRRLNRIQSFDATSGVIRAESGISLAEMLAVVIPAGWFLPVVPGTQFVTLGGAIANDVHGKNHHRDGTFGRFVLGIELWRSDGQRLVCSPSENQDLYRNSIGGLGLTGLIRTAEIQLIKIESAEMKVQRTRFGSLREFYSINATSSLRDRYTVAWIDAMASGARLGRGIYLAGDHAEGTLPEPAPPPKPRVRIPLDAPARLLNRPFGRAFNALYWRRGRDFEGRSPLQSFFFPLDQIGDWNRLYGRRGFFQYQFVVPHADAEAVVRTALKRVHAHRVTAPLAVLKSFGDVASPGALSFPIPGVTLALDVANEGDRTRRLIADIDAVVREARGRIYPAKDATMTGQDFRAQYPQWEDFARFIDPAFSSSFWRRVMS